MCMYKIYPSLNDGWWSGGFNATIRTEMFLPPLPTGTLHPIQRPKTCVGVNWYGCHVWRDHREA